MFKYTLSALSCALLASFLSSTNAYGSVVTVYDFFASWCTPCRADIARDNELQREYGDKVKFVGVNEDAEADRAKANEFIKSTKPNFEVKLDPNHAIAQSMGATNKTPSAVIVDGSGGQELINGSLSKSALMSRIDAHLK
jgi:thiol-disulfide isomerase/thioredoxin